MQDQVQSGSPGNGAGWLIQTVVLKNGAVTHYKNSQLLESFSVTFNTPAGGQMRLGVEINGGGRVDMETAAIAGWNRALGPSEVTQMVQHFAQRYQIAV
jgi:methionine synthase I (cobalamin-dependent)